MMYSVSFSPINIFQSWNRTYQISIFWRNNPPRIIETRGWRISFILTLCNARPAFKSVIFCTSRCSHDKESIFFCLLFQLKYLFRICFPPFLQFSNIAFDPFPGVITTNQQCSALWSMEGFHFRFYIRNSIKWVTKRYSYMWKTYVIDAAKFLLITRIFSDAITEPPDVSRTLCKSMGHGFKGCRVSRTLRMTWCQIPLSSKYPRDPRWILSFLTGEYRPNPKPCGLRSWLYILNTIRSDIVGLVQLLWVDLLDNINERIWNHYVFIFLLDSASSTIASDSSGGILMRNALAYAAAAAAA